MPGPVSPEISGSARWRRAGIRRGTPQPPEPEAGKAEMALQMAAEPRGVHAEPAGRLSARVKEAADENPHIAATSDLVSPG